MKQFATIIIAFIALLSMGCASQSSQSIDPENLHDLETLSQHEINFGSAQKTSKIRLQALRETALSLGAQGGLAVRSKQINQMLDDSSDKLSRIFNFYGLMLDNNVLPPVLEESSQSLNLIDSTYIRTADKTYKIVQDAKFVTTVPTRHDYLWMDYKKPKLPDNSLLPRDDNERRIWVKFVYSGWLKGFDQANTIYRDNLARLQHDYQGMLVYRNLLAQHMIDLPFVAKSNHGITANADRTEIQVNDQSIQMMSTPRLNTESETWKPAVIQPQ